MYLTYLTSISGEHQFPALEAFPPCAMVGPFSDLPALELSAVANAAQFPHVALRSFNMRVGSETFSPYTSQIFPDLMASTNALVTFLQ